MILFTTSSLISSKTSSWFLSHPIILLKLKVYLSVLVLLEISFIEMILLFSNSIIF